MNDSSSYPPPVHLDQAHSEEDLGGSRVTRRAFIKRTGGATATTMIAWNLSSTKARAKTEVVGSGSGSSDPNWKIRSAEIGSEDTPLDKSTGAQSNWMVGQVQKKVRRVLSLYAHAPENPENSAMGTAQFASSATCNVNITAKVWGEIADIVNGQAQGWAPMTESQWESWTGTDTEDAPVCNTTASLKKSVAKKSGKVTVDSRFPVGSNHEPTKLKGIHLKAIWNDDILNIAFSAISSGIEENDWDLESQWELRNYGGTGK